MLTFLSTDKQELCRLNSTPLVSVVIPAYNHERWIAETLESVFSQTLTDFELIVVDDGSKDRTVEIVGRFRDERLKLVRQENRGTAAAINRGLGLSRGRYIAILNSDDLFKPERLEVLVALLESNPGKQISFSRVSLIDAKGVELADKAPECGWLRAAEADYYKSGDLLLSLLRDNFVCTSSNFLFRRHLLVEIGHFRDLRYVNDLDFLVRSLTRCQGVFCSRELLAYRQHGDNTISERKFAKEADFVLEVAWVLASACIEGQLVRQWDFQVLSELLAKYYRLNLETLLFSILCLHSQGKVFCSLEKLPTTKFTTLLQSSRRRLDEQVFVEGLMQQVKEQLSQIETLLEAKTFHIEQSQAWQAKSEQFQVKSEQLQSQNQVILQKMRVRDQELAQAEKLQHEIWQNREWYRRQFETVINSRRFRFFTILSKIRRGEERKASLRELLRLFLPDSWRERLRGWRNKFQNLRNLDNLKAIFNERLKSCYSHLFARHYYKQKTWKQIDSPLLSLLVFCSGSESTVDSFRQQLQEQTWSEFEVCFLIAKKDSKLKRYMQGRLQSENLMGWHVLSSDFSSQTRAELFNQAFKQSQGKYIVILDSCDNLAPTFLEEALLKLEASPPHFFIQISNSFFPFADVNGATAASSLEILEKDFYRPLVLQRSVVEKLKGFNETVNDEFLTWEFYVNLVRHGCKGCSLSERIFRNGITEVQPVEGKASGIIRVKEQIRALHLGAVLNNRVKLERRVQQYWQVMEASCNFLPLPQAERESVIWLDLLDINFVPWETLPRLAEWAGFSRQPLIVTVSAHFKLFFLYNKTPGVRVYFPEEYHLQGKKDYFYSYLERRYNLQKISSVEIMAKCTSSPVNLDESISGRKKLRILYASPWLITGGADTMTVDWFRELDGEWCEKYLVTTLFNNNNWLPKIASAAAGIYDLPSLGCSTLVDVTRFLIDFISRQQIDILHIMNSELLFNALPELKKHFPGLKVVAQFHCFDYFSDGRRTGYPMTMPQRYDHLVDSYNLEYPQLGEEIVEFYPYINPGKFKVIHGSVDGTAFDPQSQIADLEIASKRRQNALNLLFIGRLDRQKQPLRLLQIADMLRHEGVAFIMHIIGDGSLESQKPEFLAKIKELKLQEQVCWYGEQPLESMVEWYRIADIMLLTSDWEGVPMVLYQAMAMQVVPVVADVGGCAELVTSESGYLITDRENPAEYVTVIKALVDDKRRQNLAANARKRMLAEFSLADLDLKYKNYYRSLMR